MDNDKAIAASAAMVAVAAVASGALFFSAQTGASNIPAQPAPQPQVVVEYVDAAGNVVPIEPAVEPASVAPAPIEPTPSDEEEYDDDHEEYEDDDHDEYEDDD